jgi:hypothetical protein
MTFPAKDICMRWHIICKSVSESLLNNSLHILKWQLCQTQKSCLQPVKKNGANACSERKYIAGKNL